MVSKHATVLPGVGAVGEDSVVDLGGGEVDDDDENGDPWRGHGGASTHKEVVLLCCRYEVSVPRSKPRVRLGTKYLSHILALYFVLRTKYYELFVSVRSRTRDFDQGISTYDIVPRHRWD